jgi:hypothetical protein
MTALPLKANLRGPDFRGARIDDFDLYLVDPRDAPFDVHQAEQFRRRGAILKVRVRGGNPTTVW